MQIQNIRVHLEFIWPNSFWHDNVLSNVRICVSETYPIEFLSCSASNFADGIVFVTRLLISYIDVLTGDSVREGGLKLFQSSLLDCIYIFSPGHLQLQE